MIQTDVKFYAGLDGDLADFKATIRHDPDFDEMHDTWEACARKALADVKCLCHMRPKSPNPQATLKLLETILGDTRSAVNGLPAGSAQGDLIESLLMIGAHAYDHVHLSADEIVEILSDKQAAYGPGNIMAFGLSGIHVRMSDKINRLANLLDKGRADFKHAESIDDTWLDLVGYATVARMLWKHVFTAPLTRDLESDEDAVDAMLAEIKQTVMGRLP